jgi:hypothetical protein
MKQLFFGFAFLTVAFSFLFSPCADAGVSVKGYYRSDGTYVAPHYRSDPDGIPTNNWSYPGNTNPYTGVTATGNPDTYLQNYGGSSAGGSSSSGASYNLQDQSKNAYASPSDQAVNTQSLTNSISQPVPSTPSQQSDIQTQSIIEQLKHQILVLQLQLQVALLQNQLAALIKAQ